MGLDQQGIVNSIYIPKAHRDIADMVRKIACEEKKHHAFLLYGRRGIGKSLLARTVAAEVLGANLERILFGIHPDLIIAEAEPIKINQDKRQKPEKILIEAIRNVKQRAQYAKLESDKSVIIIDAVDDMNYSASTALLKLLEEPTYNTVLLLVAHSINAALPTIRSRCIKLYVPDLSYEDFATIFNKANRSKPSKAKKSNNSLFLQEQGCEMISALYHITRGSIDDAIFVEQHNLIPFLNKIKNLELTTHDIIEVMNIFKEYEEHSEVMLRLVLYAMHLGLKTYMGRAPTREKLQSMVANLEKLTKAIKDISTINTSLMHNIYLHIMYYVKVYSTER